MGNAVCGGGGGQAVQDYKKRVTLSYTSFPLIQASFFTEDPKEQLKSIIQGVLTDDSDPLLKFPWQGMLQPMSGCGMFDDSTNKYNNFVFYQSKADAEAATERAGAAFKRLATVMDGAPKRVVMDALLLQFSTFSFFENRSLCPAAMSLTIVPLKDGFRGEQFLALSADFKWAELHKDLHIDAVIAGYFEEAGQTYGLISGVYPTVEMAKLVSERGWFMKLFQPKFADIVKGQPTRAASLCLGEPTI